MARKRSADNTDSIQLVGRISSRRVTRSGIGQAQGANSSPVLEDGRAATPANFVYKCASFNSEAQPRAGLKFKEMDKSLEENLLAMVDTHCTRDAEDVVEDRLMFVDAIYALCVVPASASVPSQPSVVGDSFFSSFGEGFLDAYFQSIKLPTEYCKELMYLYKFLTNVYKAIYRNIQENHSLELDVATFQLLQDLEQVWSPFDKIGTAFSTQPANSVNEKLPIDFFRLVQTIADQFSGGTLMGVKKKSVTICNDSVTNPITLGQFLLFKHLVSLLQADFHCRLQVAEENIDETLVRGSHMFKLLVSAKSDDGLQGFLRCLVCILDPSIEQMPEKKQEQPISNMDSADQCAFSEDLSSSSMFVAKKRSMYFTARSDFSRLAYDLLFMIMEIDACNEKWSSTTPGESYRNSRFFVDQILDILSKSVCLEAFLQGLESPVRKMKFILMYICKFAPKPVVHGITKVDKESFQQLLHCLRQHKNLTSVSKTFQIDVLPLILSHAFQAFLILHSEEGTDGSKTQSKCHQDMLVDICESLVMVLTTLKNLEKQDEFHAAANQAVCIAESLLQTCSAS